MVQKTQLFILSTCEKGRGWRGKERSSSPSSRTLRSQGRSPGKGRVSFFPPRTKSACRPDSSVGMQRPLAVVQLQRNPAVSARRWWCDPGPESPREQRRWRGFSDSATGRTGGMGGHMPRGRMNKCPIWHWRRDGHLCLFVRRGVGLDQDDTLMSDTSCPEPPSCSPPPPWQALYEVTGSPVQSYSRVGSQV